MPKSEEEILTEYMTFEGLKDWIDSDEARNRINRTLGFKIYLFGERIDDVWFAIHNSIIRTYRWLKRKN